MWPFAAQSANAFMDISFLLPKYPFSLQLSNPFIPFSRSSNRIPSTAMLIGCPGLALVSDTVLFVTDFFAFSDPFFPGFQPFSFVSFFFLLVNYLNTYKM